MTVQVLEYKQHPLGGFYLALDGAGRVFAGRTAERTQTFATARAAYDHFLGWALAGEHWAWNLCYGLQDLAEDAVWAKGRSFLYDEQG